MYDVAILGAGPAGAALACALAPCWQIALIDKNPKPSVQIGEALVPAAQRLLRDLGLWAPFNELAPAAYVANRSLWGSTEEEYRDFISDPEGCGWHLDRAVFETMLRNQAKLRGAQCFFSHRLVSVADGWRLTLDGAEEVTARIVIDATGRSAALARRLGSRRQTHDRMVARWCRLKGRTPSLGVSSVISTPNGWWYHIAGRRGANCEGMLAFHSLPESQPNGDAASLLDAAMCTPGLHEQLCRAMPVGDAKTIAAHTARLDVCSGTNWLSIGDAAVCFDPIASRGLFHALYSALVAAALLDERLSGKHVSFSLYDEEISRIYSIYLHQRRAVYRDENRWPDTPFWQETTSSHPMTPQPQPHHSI